MLHLMWGPKRTVLTILGAAALAGAGSLTPAALAPAAGAAVGAASASGCPVCGSNLIVNPGAEAGQGTQSDSVVPVPGWKRTEGAFTAASYAWSGGDMSPTTPGPTGRGKNYFYGGPDAAVSVGVQTVPLAVGASAIATGKLSATLSGWLGGFSSQGDDAALTASFQGAGGQVLKTLTIGPVTPAQRDDNTELLLRTATAGVPATATSVLIGLRMVRYDGSDNDGMADNLSLVFSEGSALGGSTTTTTTSSGAPTTVSGAPTSGSGAGSSPGAHAVGIEYTPQTVLVPAATVAATLRSVSPDGSTYTFSSAAGPLAKVKKGSVMFLQGTAVRLVTATSTGPSGFVVQSVAAPLTDLISSGTLSWDTKVNFADAYAIQGAAVPVDGRLLRPMATTRPTLVRPVSALSLVAPRFGLESISGSGVTLKGKAGSYGYSITFKQAGSAVSVDITLTKSSPVEVSATVSGTLQNLTTSGGIAVSGGHVGSAKVSMNNLQGQFTLSYSLKPITAFGLGAAGGFKLTLPGELTVPFAIGGIPFFLGVKTAFYVSVGFSNKNQSITGSYTVNYDGNAGFSSSSSGATTGQGAVQGIGKVLLDQANAIMSGPITLVLGAQIPQLELGLGVKGLNVAGFVDLVADTALQVGGNTGGLGASTGGCDARDLKVVATAGAEASFFGFSASLTSPVTLFSKDFTASYPPGCGTVGG
jgi:hypothetical protein